MGGGEAELMVTIKMIGPGTIDPEIKSLVIKLNKEGFATTGSCAGHGKYGCGLGVDRKGDIWFKRNVSGKERDYVVAIMKQHGCKEIRFTNPTEVRYKPMGKIAKKGDY